MLIHVDKHFAQALSEKLGQEITTTEIIRTYKSSRNHPEIQKKREDREAALHKQYLASLTPEERTEYQEEVQRLVDRHAHMDGRVGK